MRRILLILPILLLMLAQTAPQAGAQGAVVVRVTPATLTIPLNGTSDVALEVVGVEGLYGFDVTLTFDPAVVEVVDANPDKQGVQVSFGTFMEPGLSVRDSADNTTGIVRYAMTQLNPSEAKDGTGNLVVIKLRGKAAGSSQLVLTEVALAARDATEIPSTAQPGQVTITTAGGNQPTTTPIPTQAPPTPVPTAGPVPTNSTAAPTQPPEPTLPPATATGQPVAELSRNAQFHRRRRLCHKSTRQLQLRARRHRLSSQLRQLQQHLTDLHQSQQTRSRSSTASLLRQRRKSLLYLPRRTSPPLRRRRRPNHLRLHPTAMDLRPQTRLRRMSKPTPPSVRC